MCSTLPLSEVFRDPTIQPWMFSKPAVWDSIPISVSARQAAASAAQTDAALTLQRAIRAFLARRRLVKLCLSRYAYKLSLLMLEWHLSCTCLTLRARSYARWVSDCQTPSEIFLTFFWLLAWRFPRSTRGDLRIMSNWARVSSGKKLGHLLQWYCALNTEIEAVQRTRSLVSFDCSRWIDSLALTISRADEDTRLQIDDNLQMCWLQQQRAKWGKLARQWAHGVEPSSSFMYGFAFVWHQSQSLRRGLATKGGKCSMKRGASTWEQAQTCSGLARGFYASFLH